MKNCPNGNSGGIKSQEKLFRSKKLFSGTKEFNTFSETISTHPYPFLTVKRHNTVIGYILANKNGGFDCNVNRKKVNIFNSGYDGICEYNFATLKDKRGNGDGDGKEEKKTIFIDRGGEIEIPSVNGGNLTIHFCNNNYLSSQSQFSTERKRQPAGPESVNILENPEYKAQIKAVLFKIQSLTPEQIQKNPFLIKWKNFLDNNDITNLDSNKFGKLVISLLPALKIDYSDTLYQMTQTDQDLYALAIEKLYGEIEHRPLFSQIIDCDLSFFKKITESLQNLPPENSPLKAEIEKSLIDLGLNVWDLSPAFFSRFRNIFNQILIKTYENNQSGIKLGALMPAGDGNTANIFFDKNTPGSIYLQNTFLNRLQISFEKDPELSTLRNLIQKITKLNGHPGGIISSLRLGVHYIEHPKTLPVPIINQIEHEICQLNSKAHTDSQLFLLQLPAINDKLTADKAQSAGKSNQPHTNPLCQIIYTQEMSKFMTKISRIIQSSHNPQILAVNSTVGKSKKQSDNTHVEFVPIGKINQLIGQYLYYIFMLSKQIPNGNLISEAQ